MLLRRVFTRAALPLSMALLALLAGTADVAAQQVATIQGRVTAEGGGPLAGVQVIVTNRTTGADVGRVTGDDGRYVITGIRPGGPYDVRTAMIGYGVERREVPSVGAGQTLNVDFTLGTAMLALNAIEVFAARAVERSTPVAYSDVDKAQIQNQLGSRDLPMVLNVAPSVYSTMQGGGSGDARINVRGFSQRNTAVMINGVPVNDMENGWVYWSNWDGLGDAATSIQLQRGLSAVNLATPSIGGTLNIITDPTQREAGLSYKQEFGSGSFLKETLTLNTGNMDGFGLTAVVSKKNGDGLFGYTGSDRDGANDFGLATYTDAWSYYLAAAYQINEKNRLELYAVGAPQAHGQNLYKLNVATMDQEYARELGYSQAALDAFPEAGRFYSPNVAPVSPEYAEQMYASVGPKTGRFDRFGNAYMNERENYFHKPQVNLNYFRYFGEGMTWSTVAYYSGGSGGGSGTLGSLVWDYSFGQRFADWDATIERNRTNPTGSRGILRSSVNDQWTLGAISKVRKTFDAGLSGEVGIDLRMASVDHYRDVRDLLGGAYWLDKRNAFTGDRQTTYGDKIDYYNTNDIGWVGAHAQAEKVTEAGSLYGMFGLSRNSYDYTDHFKKGEDGGKLNLQSGGMLGYQAKGGVSRNLNELFSLYGNAGYISKVPNFDGVINDATGKLNPDPQNESFLSFEAGMNYRAVEQGLGVNLNLYHTTWRDQTATIYVPNEDIQANILGVDERHIGVELESSYQPTDLFRFDASASFGDWTYLDDATGRAVSGDLQTEEEYAFYIRDLKVSDQPQTQFAYAVSVFPTSGAFVRLQGQTNANYYAAFSPFGRTDPTDRSQSWEVPSHTTFDLHAGTRVADLIPVWTGGDVRLFANVFNVFDALYVQDATDDSSYNGFHDDGRHDASSAEVFLGLPRTFNLGAEIVF